MDDSNKKATSDNLHDMNKSEMLVAAAELEKRRYESQQQLDRYIKERRHLEEIHKTLSDEKTDAKKSLSTVRQQADDLDMEINSLTSHNLNLEEEIEKYRGSITDHSGYCAEYSKLDDQLAQQIITAERTISETLRLLHQVASQLESDRLRLMRLKDKCSDHKPTNE